MTDKNSPSHARNEIVIQGARVNNLKNVDISIPRNKFVVITGLSGSGKSSLAFDTIYAEGNRRYMESLSSYARNFLDVVSKPDVDRIDNLSPTISIDQKSINRSPRSTVGTLTEVYDYLRVLFAKLGEPECPICGAAMKRRTNREILSELLTLEHNTQLYFLTKPEVAPDSVEDVLSLVQQWGYARVYANGKLTVVSEARAMMDKLNAGDIFVVIDRMLLDRKNADKERMIDSIQTSFKLGNGNMSIVIDGKELKSYSQDFSCASCGVKIKEITARHFSFNNPEGACNECSGIGLKYEIDSDLLMPNKNLSINEGAVQIWNKALGKGGIQNGSMDALKLFAKKHAISLADPVRKIPREKLKLILYGENKVAGYEGIVPGLEKKYEETKSDYIRSEIERYMLAKISPACKGRRLKKEFLSVKFRGRSIDDLVNLSVTDLKQFFEETKPNDSDEVQSEIYRSLSKEIVERLRALENVGLDYLSMARGSQTISGGEGQRIRLAVQIKSELMGIIYVLDEPSIGLHKRDTEKLINTMKALKDAGNSLVVVEHDEDIIKASDWIVDMGPGAGEEGGEVIFEDTLDDLKKSKNLTAQYVFKKKKVVEAKKMRKGTGKYLELNGVEEHNLKNIDVKIPLGKFIVISGVSGSGKSTLVSDVLSPALSRIFYRSKATPGKHKNIKGIESVDKVITVNQDPIGRTPRSNAATYTGLFTHIREIFAETEEAKTRGYSASQFSFNMKGGRCEFCQGEGLRKIEMHLLPDMYVKCESCGGTRYNQKTLEIEYRGVNIAEVLDMSVSYALRFFKNHPLIVEKLRTMEEVGLGYLRLGQSATNLSGGEAQRIKLATELARKSTGKTLYILDEPTIGLHFEDISRLLQVLNALVDKGNTVLVVEHNTDVILGADWVIELGPDGGQKGGEIIYEGAPDRLKNCKRSWTGRYL